MQQEKYVTVYYEHQDVDVPMYNHFHWNICHLCLCTSIFSNIFSRKHQLPFHTCSCSNGFSVFSALLILLDDNPLNIYTFPLPQLYGADEQCPHILISNLLPKWLISVKTELFSCEHSHGKEKHLSHKSCITQFPIWL